VFDPIGIPPLDWIDKGIMNEHAEVEVITSRQSSGAGSAQNIASG
jgi:hypothetical protein